MKREDTYILTLKDSCDPYSTIKVRNRLYNQDVQNMELNKSLIKDFGEFCSLLIAHSATHRSRHMLLLFQFAHTLSAK
jgi:hypothetical protein